MSGERLVEDRGAVLAGDAERLLLDRLDDAEPERGQRPAAGEPVEGRPLLGQQDRVAPGQHLHAACRA